MELQTLQLDFKISSWHQPWSEASLCELSPAAAELVEDISSSSSALPTETDSLQVKLCLCPQILVFSELGKLQGGCGAPKSLGNAGHKGEGKVTSRKTGTGD